MQQPGRAHPLLRGAADLPLVRGDVVERLVERVHAEPGERVHGPLVQERVGLRRLQPVDQRRRHVHRVRDAVVRLHEHRAAAGDPPHHVDAVPPRPLGVHLVGERLEGADHHGRLVPLPQAHGRLATSLGHLPGEHLVQGHGQRDRHRLRPDDLPLVVPPRGRLAEGPTHGRGDREGVHAEQLGLGSQTPLDGLPDDAVLGVRGQPGHRRVEVLERLIRLEEEVAVDARGRDPAVREAQVRRDQLAADHLVFTVESRHARQPTGDATGPAPPGSLRGRGARRRGGRAAQAAAVTSCRRSP